MRSRSPKITSGTSKLAQRKGLQFYQTRSHAIALFNTLPATCIEKEIFLKTGEDSYSKVFQSPRLPRVVLTPKLQHGRQDPSNPEARTSADHQSEQSAKYEETRRSHLQNFRHKHLEENHRAKYKETCRGNVDYRIQGMLHSTVQKEDSNRKEIVKKLIQQFENHPHRDSLIKDLNKTGEFNPFSEKSKELITWVTRSTSRCARPLLKYNVMIVLSIGKLASYTAPAANVCSRRKGIDS